uniref:Uncharacterized protein n=1 Tax=uncultured marine group II/III euryarchaeote KM3_157_F12 TaxID=1457905 RepID=A0A075GFH0_9EURY|nr:hypothetical protein [uncultured marine group II/III euryarchaeote KM3_157_F12]
MAASEFVKEWRAVASSLHKGIDWLEGFIQENQEFVIEKDDKLMVRGKLAIYSIDMAEVLSRIKNPLASSGSGLPRIGIQPLSGRGKTESVSLTDLVRSCIQVRNLDDEPSPDSLKSLLLFLMTDVDTFHAEGLQPLRDGLMTVYGLHKSPLSPQISKFIAEEFGGTYDEATAVAEIPGSAGWLWRLEYLTLVDDFRLSVRLPQRKNWKVLSEAVNEDDLFSWPSNIFEIMSYLRDAPKSILDEDYYLPMTLPKLLAPSHKPIRLFLEELEKRY